MVWRTLSLLVVLVGYSVAQQHVPPVDGSYLHDPRNVQNKEHIREHMTDYYKEDDIDEQLNLDSEEATQFHYFKLHDYDNNNKLDGLELYAAITHFSNEHGEEEGKPANTVQLEEAQIERLVESILEQDDENDDGFVDYYEFVQAQKLNKEKSQEQNNL